LFPLVQTRSYRPLGDFVGEAGVPGRIGECLDLPFRERVGHPLVGEDHHHRLAGEQSAVISRFDAMSSG
jgi:hypothetical protein